MPVPEHSHLPAEMKAAIHSFDEESAAVVNSFARKLDQNPPPATIFHYTDDAGLRGIIESEKLRLTDIFYLNDPSEIRYGCSPAIELLTSAISDARPEIEQFSNNVRAMLHNGIEDAGQFFTLSFSMNGNDLGQWRAYGDNGRGYSIGFDAQTLEEAFVKQGPNWMTFPVTYDETELQRIHKELVDRALPLVLYPPD